MTSELREIDQAGKNKSMYEQLKMHILTVGVKGYVRIRSDSQQADQARPNSVRLSKLHPKKIQMTRRLAHIVTEWVEVD